MRALTKSDRERGDKLRELGCIVCLIYEDVFTPCAIHHIDGKTKEGCHDLTIGLCGNHHQIKCNDKRKRWVSRHGDGKRAFVNVYGKEEYLLNRTNGLINE
jgi:hypothetical protein